jgi:hypothetical protein
MFRINQELKYSYLLKKQNLNQQSYHLLIKCANTWHNSWPNIQNNLEDKLHSFIKKFMKTFNKKLNVLKIKKTKLPQKSHNLHKNKVLA